MQPTDKTSVLDTTSAAQGHVAGPGLSLNTAVLRIGPQVGVNPDTLGGWHNQADIDAGADLGDHRRRAPLKELERDVAS